MRDIEFRGKCSFDGEWLYGDLSSRHNSPEFPLYPCIGSGRMHEVYPDTIGQFTGLKDINGVKIFEGDIVINYMGLFKRAQVKWDEKNLAWGVLTLGKRNYPLCVETEYEVIGNVHDNPEML